MARLQSTFTVVLLLLISAGLYTTAINYGQPQPEYAPATFSNGWLNGATIFHPDAYDYTARPYAMLLRNISPLKPNFYHNPSLTINLNLLMSWVSGATSLYQGPIDLTTPQPEGQPLDCESGLSPHPMCLRQIAPFSVYVVARYLSVLLCLLAVATIFAAVRNLFEVRAGFLAAALVAFSPLVTQHAHYETPGAATLLFSSAALGASLLLLKKRSQSGWVHGLVGLSVGLSASSRYNAVVVVVVAGMAMAVAWWHHRQIAPIIVGVLAMPVGFLIGTPGVVFESRRFFSGIRYILYWYTNIGGGPGWTADSPAQSVFYYWRYTALIVLGPPAFGLAVMGLIALLRQRSDYRRWIGIGLLVYLVIYTAAALSSRRLNANLLIPAVFPTALLAAYGATQLRAGFARSALTLVLVGWPFGLSVYFANFIQRPDTRLQAQAWIQEHIPAQTPIHLLGSYNVPLDPLLYPLSQTYGTQISPTDPLWDAPLIVYSDAGTYAALRDLSLTSDPDEVESARQVADRLTSEWRELARFERVFWPGQALPPDDVSFWHQMEIVIYCNPDACPI